ncbi:hypothetical protein Vqi01_10850 [Micromonospora qiuiae]|uniref:Uncharacterized protein n=1 Tax=Micromonospora qiuiae TaxID=502268 RepID=A0ABQ4J799_9ACTN|nr:hypothetical protein Vqi01_10850 [Micromonospora qiuiae]
MVNDEYVHDRSTYPARPPARGARPDQRRRSPANRHSPNPISTRSGNGSDNDNDNDSDNGSGSGSDQDHCGSARVDFQP